MPTELRFEPEIIDLTGRDVAVCIAKALDKTGWKQTGGLPEHRYLIAQLKEEVPIHGTLWSWTYQANFEWKEIGQQTSLTIVLSEKKYNSSQQQLQMKQAELFAAIRKEFADRLECGPVQPDPNLYDVSKFASREELRNVGILDCIPKANKAAVFAALKPGRFFVTSANIGCLSLPPEFTARHVFLCGSTGAGKSSGLFVTNLLAATNTSAIVTEVLVGDGETSLYNATAGWRAHKGHTIHYFNPLDKKSCRINPLDMVQDDADARHVTNLIMKATATPGAHRSEQFWETSERILLTALILHAVGEREKGNCTFNYICRLLENNDEQLQEIVGNSEIDEAARRFNTFMSRGSKDTRNITITMVSNRLDLFRNDLIAELTRTTDFNATRLPDELFTLYIAIPADTEFVQPVAILVWNYILKLSMEAKFKNKLMLLLDEFANFGYIKGMREKLTLLRHKGIGVMFGVQFIKQLELVYHDEASVFLTQPATRIYFKPIDNDEAQQLCRSLGKTTKVEELVSPSGLAVRYHERDLMSVQKLTSMPPSQMLVFWPNANPTLEMAMTYIDTKDFTRIPPPARRIVEADTSLKRRIKPLVPSTPEEEQRAIRSLNMQKRKEDELVGQQFDNEDRECQRRQEISIEQAIANFASAKTATDYLNYDEPDMDLI